MSRKKETAIGAAVALAATASMTGAAQGAVVKVTNTHDHGPGSLRRAIGIVNTSSPDHIVFRSGLSGDITLDRNLPRLESPVNIKGPGKNRLRIDGQGEHQIFEVVDTATVSGLTLKNGYNETFYTSPPCDGRCGGSYEYGPAGGAITLERGANLKVRGVRFADNHGHFGGAISAEGSGDVTVRSSVFSGNTSGTDGGAINEGDRYSDGGSSSAHLTIVGSRFDDNSAGDEDSYGVNFSKGGAIATTVGATSAIRRSTFSSNAAGTGGALSLNNSFGDSSSVINASTFTENAAHISGGGASISGEATITNSNFVDNYALEGGGLDVEATKFEYPSSGVDHETFSISNSTISGNTARAGGDTNTYIHSGGGGVNILTYGDDFASFRNVTIANNVARNGEGGGIEAWGPNLALDSVTISGNRAESSATTVDGGGINQAQGTTTIRNSIVSGNSAGLVNDLGVHTRIGEPTPTFSIAFSLIGPSGSAPVTDPVPGSNRYQTEPGLGELKDNGGPGKTMVPDLDSLAINSGSTPLDEDGRGFVRPVKLKGVPRPAISGADYSDMGAVERQNKRHKVKPKHGKKGS